MGRFLLRWKGIICHLSANPHLTPHYPGAGLAALFAASGLYAAILEFNLTN